MAIVKGMTVDQQFEFVAHILLDLNRRIEKAGAGAPDLTASEKQLVVDAAARYARAQQRVRRVAEVPTPADQDSPVPMFTGVIKSSNADGTVTVTTDVPIAVVTGGAKVMTTEVTVPREWVEKEPVTTA